MRRIFAALLVAAGLLLAGCGTATPVGAGSADVGVGQTANLDFSATTIDGGSFSGSQLQGKPTVLWFWAPWCPTCRAQIPAVTALAKKYAGRVDVVGVGGLDSAGAIRGLAEKMPDLTNLVDANGEVWKHFGVTEQSTFRVISANGKIVASGYLTDADLAARVAKLSG